ncbi:hypothetical protein ACHAWF_010591 [Thalassiosira exigua]
MMGYGTDLATPSHWELEKSPSHPVEKADRRDFSGRRAGQDDDEADAELDLKLSLLEARLRAIVQKKLELERECGDPNASGHDLIEINAGGKVVAAKRSTLTQQMGTRFEALFGGRWDKKLARDGGGRIFLDVNPKCFRSIVDYLSEVAISSEDDPSGPPTVDEEDGHILRSQLELFGLHAPKIMDSDIIRASKDADLLHQWLEEDGSSGDLDLLYRSSRDGSSSSSFHSKCDGRGPTLTVIETADGYVLGGYTNTPWASVGCYRPAGDAFLFVLSGDDATRPRKMKLKNARDRDAVWHSPGQGPTFGAGDLRAEGSDVRVSFGRSYESGPPGRLATPADGTAVAKFEIKEMEVFRVRSRTAPRRSGSVRRRLPEADPTNGSSLDVDEAIRAKKDALRRVEEEVLRLEESFEDERNFIAAFANDDFNDLVELNVNGTVMTTRRSTLRAAEDSVLARQFDDAIWNRRGSTPRVEEWTPDDVCNWVRRLSALREDVGTLLKENDVTGSELLAMDSAGLKTIGVKRLGTVCVLLKRIETLHEASGGNQATLIEHSPYCFGKILDQLRLSRLSRDGFVEAPAPPRVCDSQRKRFEKVANYYFPGDASKFLLG